jgi:hypothetical protein
MYQTTGGGSFEAIWGSVGRSHGIDVRHPRCDKHPLEPAKKDAFAPTHSIRIVRGETERRIPVMASGPNLYTEVEWNACASNDWEIKGDKLSFQGRSANLYEVGSVVELIAL